VDVASRLLGDLDPLAVLLTVLRDFGDLDLQRLIDRPRVDPSRGSPPACPSTCWPTSPTSTRWPAGGASVVAK
jgi:hypothetical protein